MGIKRYAGWFKKIIGKHVEYFNSNSIPMIGNKRILLDLNGLIHSAAQKVFKYGDYAEQPHLLTRKHIYRPTDEMCYAEVCNMIEEFVRISCTKNLILAIDSVAPIAKQQQQRQRRYKTIVEESSSSNFDPVCISAGTTFLRNFSLYLEKFITKKVKHYHWDVILSDDECPGEGEHKLISYLRKYGEKDERYCIHAQDADLYMLTMAVPNLDIILLREEQFMPNFKYSYTYIKNCREELQIYLNRDDQRRCVYDFILMCFFTGNDFLPQVPLLTIDDGGLDKVMAIYRDKDFYICDEMCKISYENLEKILKEVDEDKLYHKRYENRDELIQDPLLNESNFNEHRKLYNTAHIQDVETQSIDYLKTLQWNMNYYIHGINNWSWSYRYNYVPHATDLLKYIKGVEFDDTYSPPTHPVHQLLCILPPPCHYLLPKHLQAFAKLHPEFYVKDEDIKINYEGKKQKWEGIVDIPPINFNEVEKLVPLDQYEFKVPINYINKKYNKNPDGSITIAKSIIKREIEF